MNKNGKILPHDGIGDIDRDPDWQEEGIPPEVMVQMLNEALFTTMQENAAWFEEFARHVRSGNLHNEEIADVLDEKGVQAMFFGPVCTSRLPNGNYCPTWQYGGWSANKMRRGPEGWHCPIHYRGHPEVDEAQVVPVQRVRDVGEVTMPADAVRVRVDGKPVHKVKLIADFTSLLTQGDDEAASANKLRILEEANAALRELYDYGISPDDVYLSETWYDAQGQAAANHKLRREDLSADNPFGPFDREHLRALDQEES